MHNSPYKLKHLILIITLILLFGMVLLWFFYSVLNYTNFEIEIYLVLVIYLTMLIVTGFIIKSSSIIAIHKTINFRKTKLKYFVFSVIIAIIVWCFDYFTQVYVFNIDMYQEASSWLETFNYTQVYFVFFSMIIATPVIEEMLFRGIILQTMNSYMSRIASAIIVSVLFALVHYSLFQTLSLFIASMFYVYLTYKSKSIIPAISAHIINNLITFVFYINLVQ